MNEKKFTISGSVLEVLMEQVNLQPKATANLIAVMVKNDVKLIEEDKAPKDGKKE